jgi:hypothetical protein
VLLLLTDREITLQHRAARRVLNYEIPDACYRSEKGRKQLAARSIARQRHMQKSGSDDRAAYVRAIDDQMVARFRG